MSDDMVEQPRDAIAEWRERRRKFIEERSADYARRHPETQAPQMSESTRRFIQETVARFPPEHQKFAEAVLVVTGPALIGMMRAVARDVREQIDTAKVHMRREIELRTARRRKTPTTAERARFN
jgi:hypothetical protein